MKQVIALAILLLLAGCGSSGQKNVVDNPYAERMKELSRNGVAAMQRERWLVAEKLLDRALQAAQLANSPILIGQAWYNLGTLHISSGSDKKGEDALKRAISVAEQHQQQVTLMRAKIALARLHQKQGKGAWQPDVLAASMPIDIHLALARLAHLQKRYDVAQHEYRLVSGSKNSDRASMLYKTEAHMGLALIAEQFQDHGTARQEARRVLDLSRKIGTPRLAAHALLLSAKLEGNKAAKKDYLEDALPIYEALKDERGQKDVLFRLKKLAEEQNDSTEVEAIQEKLQLLEK
ncbi:MAG: hypothetical protein ABUK11_02340 [Mariprofundaceae bacterium]